MPAIKSAHDFEAKTNIPEPDIGAGRSRYSYLFAGLADHDRAGLFQGTDDQGTVDRLQKFKIASHPLADPDPTVLMALPAAYTYFGQFMNHDISAPVGQLLTNVSDIPSLAIIGNNDLAGLRKEWRTDTHGLLGHFVNEHPEPLNLCSLYGFGTHDDAPDAEVADLFEKDGKRFRLGQTKPAGAQFFIDQKKNPALVFHAREGLNPAPDIPRVAQLGAQGDTISVPQIADRRNDGNLILSQMHLAFMLAHNKAVDAVEARDPAETDSFRAARHLVTLHYHWLILHDFLPNLLSRAVVGKPLAQWVKNRIKPGTVPMEFTTAAFRFGHSMVGKAYDFNANFGVRGVLSGLGASLQDLFTFTSRRNMGRTDDMPCPLPDHWVVDWNRLTQGKRPDAAPGDPPGMAEQIDVNFAPAMLNIAGAANVIEDGGSIMFRNLLRGFQRRMPFGQLLAGPCGTTALDPDQVLKAILGGPSPTDYQKGLAAAATELGFLQETPAWLYFLCESKALEGGERVGPTASQIIADTILGLMKHNADSALSHDGGRWHPRDSVLKDKDDTPLETIRAFLLFATEGITQEQGL